MSVKFTLENFDSKKANFSRWIDRLNCQFKLNKTPDASRLFTLYSIMGQETYEILCDKLEPTKPADSTLTYEEIVELINNHFDPKPLEIVENYKFHLRKQGAEEGIADYITAIRKISSKCNFGTFLETALRNQLVFGIKDARIQGRLLEEAELTLKRAIDLSLALELAYQGGAEMISLNKPMKPDEINYTEKKYKKSVSNNSTSNEKLNYNNYKKMSEKNRIVRKCYRCGSETHLAPQCSHLKTECSKCHKTGHLAKVCKFNPNYNTTNFINVNKKEEDDEEYEEIFSINNLQKENFSKYLIDMNVNDKVIRFEIDSGSSVTLINNNDRLKWFPNLKLISCDKEIASYCGKKIKIYGILQVNVKNYITDTDETTLPMYVVESERHPLLGREWINNIKLDWNIIIKNQMNCNIVVEEQCNKIAIDCKDLISKYPIVFENSTGKIANIVARLNLKEKTSPVFIRARSIPFSLKPKVEEELQKWVDSGILVKVDYSDWATPIVPVKKANGNIRICGDYKISVNPNIMIDEHPLPTVEELFADMAGGEKFSKIDLTQAYLQMEIHPSDRHIMTLSTHKGLYQPTRLMYGIASAPAIWQRNIEIILGYIPGVKVFLDDIKITGPNDKIHLERLELVLSRLSSHNMRVNAAKCEFFSNSIVYCGYVIDKNGINKMKSKIEAMEKMPQPINKDQVRAFVGFVNYYGRFFPNLSTILFPINQLLKIENEFIWDKKCEKSFLEVKKEMMSNRVLAHYDTKLPLILATDASPYGVSAVLSHIYPDGSERPIHYASQTLNATQQRYAHHDKEAYAIVFGVKKFYTYVFGRKFILYTDNKAILQIFSPKKGLPILSATRMQHYAVFLESFDYDIRYKNTKQHGNADGLPRLPLKSTNNVKMDEVDVLEIELINNLPLTVQELSEETIKDSAVKLLIQGLTNGRSVDPKNRFGIDQNEFTLQQHCLMKGIRVYIPPSLRKRVLAELHIAHFGISRMKSLARGYCWWKSIDKDIETLSKDCSDCQETRAEPRKVPIHHWEPATKPFQRIHADYAGPFKNFYFYIIVDSYTKWAEVYITNNMSADTTIKLTRNFFATFGIPNIFVTDRGTQFTSNEFSNFMKRNGVQHKMGAPYHPATNGQAERYVQTIKNKLCAMACNKLNVEEKLCSILLNYRKTIHPATGKSPSMMVFGRQIRSRLDLMIPSESNKNQGEIVGNIRNLNLNQRVSVRDYLNYGIKWQFGMVIEKLGKLHYLIKLDDGRFWTRHIDQIRLIGENCVSDKTPNIANVVPASHVFDHPPIILKEKQSLTETVDHSQFQNERVNHEVRKSTRITKPIERLQY